MNECYTYETLNYKKGLFDESIDVTYIITMEESIERHEHIRNELMKHKPTSQVIIVFNKGYKKCSKSYHCGEVDISYKDLTHAVMHIFDISKEKGNILILEDDFIFNNDITDKDIDNVTEFLGKKKPDAYSLGSIQFIVNPISLTHRKLLAKLGTHAMIYSKKGRDNLIKKFENCSNISHDIDMLTFYPSQCYGFHKNVYAQIFSETENMSNWGKSLKYVPTFLIKAYIGFFIVISSLFGIDKEERIHKKYDNLNKSLLLLNLIVFIFMIYLFTKIIKRLKVIRK
tara:strand:+ start:208 stop:1062 length:855 start_codon:yes stop_codon:yes gene_type:complete